MRITFAQSARSLASVVVVLASPVLLPLVATSDEADEAGGAIEFHRDIRPILSSNCFQCHGPDAAARKAGLRLDRRESAQGPLRGGGFAVVPADPDASRLVERISAVDDLERMPPPESGRYLSAEQIDLLRQWIEEGAVWERHWAYMPPVRSRPVAVQDERWCRDPIDHYILARLEREWRSTVRSRLLATPRRSEPTPDNPEERRILTDQTHDPILSAIAFRLPD